MKPELIAQLAFAGAVTGFLIGPDSLDQFIGMFPHHSTLMNVIGGLVLGVVSGAALSLLPETE